eukprot:1523798-Rhodomonas_salina.7
MANTSDRDKTAHAGVGTGHHDRSHIMMPGTGSRCTCQALLPRPPSQTPQAEPDSEPASLSDSEPEASPFRSRSSSSTVPRLGPRPLPVTLAASG